MRGLLASLCILLAGCQSASDADAPSAACVLPAPVVLEQSGDPHGADGRLLQVWELDDTPALWSGVAPVDAGYADFRSKLATLGVETDPIALLRASPATDEQLTANNRLVADNAAQWIRPAGCLERLLVGLQQARRDTFAAPTEFASIVMRSADDRRVRIYFFTINQDGIGRMSPLTAPAMRDRAAGWRVAIGLHLHAFHPGNALLNGIVSPSIADADFNTNFAGEAGMAEAWITNGVSTVRIPAAAFGRFERM